MSKSKSDLQFRQQFATMGRNSVELLGEYRDATVKIKCRCKKCGHEWSAFPNNLLNGSGCAACHRRKMYLSHEEFANRAAHADPNLEILGKYQGMTHPIRVRCRQCNRIQDIKPISILRHTGCQYCGSRRHGMPVKTQTEFDRQMQQKGNPFAECITPYTGVNKRIHVKCRLCSHEWTTTPHSLLQGCGCPKCRRKNKSNLDKPYEK